VNEVKRQLPEYRARVQAVQNQAVFEVPRVLQRILEGLPARPLNELASSRA